MISHSSLPLRFVVIVSMLAISTTSSAAVAVQNKSNKTIWVACGFGGMTQGGFANDFTSFANFIGGVSLAPGETKTIVESNNVSSAWLHVTVNNQSVVPTGAASFKLDKASVIQCNRANPKKTDWIFLVPEFTKLSPGRDALQKGDTARSLDGRNIDKLPSSPQVTVTTPGNIQTAVSQRGSLSFFKVNPNGTYVFQGDASAPVKPTFKPQTKPTIPAKGKPTPSGANTVVIPMTVKFKNAYTQRAFVTLKTDKGAGMATSLAAGETRSFSLLGQPDVTPTVVVQQPGGGVLSFSISSGGDYVLRLDGGKLKNFFK